MKKLDCPMVELPMQMHYASKKAILASLDGIKANAIWIPLHLIDLSFEGRNLVVVSMPEWFAAEHKLVEAFTKGVKKDPITNMVSAKTNQN